MNLVGKPDPGIVLSFLRSESFDIEVSSRGRIHKMRLYW